MNWVFQHRKQRAAHFVVSVAVIMLLANACSGDNDSLLFVASVSDSGTSSTEVSATVASSSGTSSSIPIAADDHCDRGSEFADISGSDELATVFSGEIVFPVDVWGVVPSVKSVDISVKPHKFGNIFTGDYKDFALELRDDSDLVVDSINFGVRIPFGNYDSVGEEHPNYNFYLESKGNGNLAPSRLSLGQDIKSFEVTIANAPVFDSFAILWKGEELMVANQSDHDPVVTVSGVSAGQKFGSDDLIDLCVLSEDSEGDLLDFEVYYSFDNGDSYSSYEKLVGSGLFRVAVDAGALAGSDEARLGVAVSDGTRVKFLESEVFSIAEHVPEIILEFPSPNIVFKSGIGYGLSARVHDPERAIRRHEVSVSVHSSIDGELTRFWGRNGSSLSPGLHTITVTAVDSLGLSSTATTKLYISDANTAPDAVDDIAHLPILTPVKIEVLENDFDFDGDLSEDNYLDLPYFEITKQPKLGDAKISRRIFTGYPDLPSSLHIEYFGGSSGYDALEYRICDGKAVCDTATVYIRAGLGDCTVLGTERDDALMGTSGDDIICGLGGDDIIWGLEGNDIIRAGIGDDLIFGGAGDDYIRGEMGDDIIWGMAGSDILLGGTGADAIYGGRGYDTLGGQDELSKRDTKDELYFGDTKTVTPLVELAPEEIVFIDDAIAECQRAGNGREFFVVESECADLLLSFCQSLSTGDDHGLDSSVARRAVIDSICQLADMAEQGKARYEQGYGYSIGSIGSRSERERVVDEALDLHLVLVRNLDMISEPTAMKLRELAETISNYTAKAHTPDVKTIFG